MKPYLIPFLLLLTILFVTTLCVAEDHSACYLSDTYDQLTVTCKQGWGRLGLNTAAVPTDGRPGGTLKLGDTIYDKGLGHHAPGEFVIQLPEGEYAAFAADVGVHWQGGARGSVVFQIFVDGEKQFDSGKMTDSDAPQPVNIPLTGARELRLVATDAGDGYGCDMANWVNACFTRDPNAMRFGTPAVTLNGQPGPEQSAGVCGFSLFANDTGPQVVSLGRNGFAVALESGEESVIDVPIFNVPPSGSVEARLSFAPGLVAPCAMPIAAGERSSLTLDGGAVQLETIPQADGKDSVLRFRATGQPGGTCLQCRAIRLVSGGDACDVRVMPRVPRQDTFPPRVLPGLRPALAQVLIEWDWRMQDGIGTEREPVTYAVAIERLLASGDALLRNLRQDGTALDDAADQWQGLRGEYGRLADAHVRDDDLRWESLWLRVHAVRRDIVFTNPLADVGPLLFVKRVPASFSHQLTQYYGRSARAGGGVFVLDTPGQSMQARELVSSQLAPGSYMLPEVTYDASRILFAYCEVPWTPTRERKQECLDRHYHLFEVKPDGSGLRQITEGPYDDFSARELPNGNLMFLSTRRGGFHRCGAGPCAVYTLAIAEGDGSNPRTVSYHETQEWDPAVLADGRVIYTRWDYVDRNAVHYQQLWTVRADGSAPAAYYGNNTFNPVGVWEPQQVPNSPLVMATAAAHHAMTAGSIILLDTTKGVDGLAPLTRLTPDAAFPESETHVTPRNWHAPGSPKEYDTPEAQRRWPGHCYRSPYPLSEKYFLAAYSFDALIGEPDGNKPNMFGLYFVDAFGNKELLYRDLNIASQWPVPIRPRTKPPVMAPASDVTVAEKEGTFFLQDVYASDPTLPKESIKQLRIVQVLPKTTPNANNPPVGFANASPGKQVLGTVSVEPDGSAYFKAPAGIPLSFQALDDKGRAVQVMRSITYLQPGEAMSCVGCHENRLSAPPQVPKAMAMTRPPSDIQLGPDGSNPLSYPLLVQPVLDKHCVKCHSGEEPAGPEGCPIILTGEPEGKYSKSYNILAKRVPYSSWGGLEANGEPATQPGRFGSRASGVMDMLLAGHHKVQLDADDMNRLTTWMDANALFYGTFDVNDQARQLRGERIEGPALQ